MSAGMKGPSGKREFLKREKSGSPRAERVAVKPDRALKNLGPRSKGSVDLLASPPSAQAVAPAHVRSAEAKPSLAAAPPSPAPAPPLAPSPTAADGGDAKLAAKLAAAEQERNFYYQKLRDLEVFLDYTCDTSGGGEHTAVAAHQVRAILYASNDVFLVGLGSFFKKLRVESTLTRTTTLCGRPKVSECAVRLV
jgi:hypothetical protein